jgi:vacuolar-type H+-ATPase subunit D/Vma8
MNAITKLEFYDALIAELKTEVRDEDTGHIRTTISVLEEKRDQLKKRLTELVDQLKDLDV